MLGGTLVGVGSVSLSLAEVTVTLKKFIENKILGVDITLYKSQLGV